MTLRFSDLRFALPQRPYHRDPENTFGPKALDHVKVGGWVTVQVGDDHISPEGSQVNLIYATVVRITPAGKVFAVVCDQVQDPSITGLESHDCIELELADINRSEHSPAQLQWEPKCRLDEVENQLFNDHGAGFEARYPDSSEGAREEMWPFQGQEWEDWLRRWYDARKVFLAELMAARRM